MPTILATDTSTTVNTVALYRDGALLAETLVDCGRRHAERLLAVTDALLREVGCALPDVDALAVSVGPGSFTGLRIGTSTWKGLARGADKPLVGVPTLDAMARLAAPHDGWVCPVLDARMGEVYAALYHWESGERSMRIPPRVGEIGAFLALLPPEPVHFLGDGVRLYGGAIRARGAGAVLVPAWAGVPRAAAVAAEAAVLLAAGDPGDPAQVSPLYLRLSQAEENRARRASEAGTA